MAAFSSQKAPENDNVLIWDFETVAAWISKLGFGDYSPFFIENKISGDVLVYLDHSDLIDIGVKSVGHRLTILKSIYQLIVDSETKLDDGPHYIPPTAMEQAILKSRIISSVGSDIGSPGTEIKPDVVTFVGDMSVSPSDIGDDQIIRNNQSWSKIVRSFEIRDERISYAEAEIKRLVDGYVRLREDLLPIFRIVKESEPLPTPDALPVPSPGPTSALPSQAHNQSSPTLLAYANSPTPTSPPSFITTFPPGGNNGPGPNSGTDRGPLSASSISIQPSSASLQASYNPTTSIQSKKNNASKVLSPSIPSNSKSPTGNQTEYYDEANRTQLPSTNSRMSRKASLNGIAPSSISASSTPVSVAPSSSLNTPNSSSTSSTEPFKSFRVSMDDPCYKVLPAALRKYKINGDPRQYALLVCYGDQERLLGLEEKPLIIFKELQDAGKRPVFMLRHIEGSHSGSQGGVVVSGTPGGVL